MGLCIIEDRVHGFIIYGKDTFVMKWKLQQVKKYFMKHQYIMKWGICLIFLICIMFGFYKAYLEDRIPGYVTHVGNRNEEQVIHDLTSDFIVKQQFKSPRDFDFITLDFSDHDQTIAGKTALLVRDTEGEMLIYKELDNHDIHYGQSVKLFFENEGKGKGDALYSLEIYESDTEETGLGIYGYTAQEGEYTANVNGSFQEYAVSIGTHSYTNYFKILVWIEMFLCVAGTCIVIVVSSRKGYKEEQLFLTIAIPFAIGMLLLLSVNSVYDPPTHFAKVYQDSNTLLGKGGQDSRSVTYLREQDEETLRGNISSFTENDQAQEAWRVWKDWQWFDRGKGMVKNTYYIPTYGGTILAYLPNSLGLALGRILGLGTYPAIMLSKITGLLIYLMMCYWAIKKTPILKTVFAFTAALPISLYNATGMTYDTMAIAAALVTCAYIFEWWERPLKKTDWAIFLTAVVFLAGCKGGVYLPLTLLIFLVPYKRFKFNRKKILVIGTFLLVVGMLFLAKYGGVAGDLLQGNAGEKYGAGYSFRYPFSFFKMLLLSLVERADIYIGQLLGYRTSWMNDVIEWVVMIPFLVLLLAGGVTEEQEKELPLARRLFVFLLVLAEFVGMHIVLLGDTRLEYHYIYGVQGRYFVALIPLMVLVLRDNNLVRKKNTANRLYVVYSIMQMIYMFSFMDKFLNA